jgi:hypothetical protein
MSPELGRGAGTVRYYLIVGGLGINPAFGATHQLCAALPYHLNKDDPLYGEQMPTALDKRLSRRFWFEHSSGERLFPYKLRDNKTGRVTYRVAVGRAGAHKVENQVQLDDVEDVYRYVFGKNYSVRMCSPDGETYGMYAKDGYSIVRTSED